MLTSESEGTGEIRRMYVGMVSDPTSSRIVGEDSELLSWQREAAQNIKLGGANNCGTHCGTQFFFLSIVLLQ